MRLKAAGAYGRIATLEHWITGMDFQIIGGPYFSKRDVKRLKADGYEAIEFYLIDRLQFIVIL